LQRAARSRRWRTRASAAGLGALLMCGAFTLVNGWLTYRVARARRSYPLQQVLVHDLVALSLVSGRYELPGFMKESGQPSTVPELAQIYDPYMVDSLWCCDDSVPRFRLVYERGLLRDLTRAWQAAVVANPRAYLAHRALLFGAQLGIG